MASPSITILDAGSSTTNSSSYSTASNSPTANRLQLLVIRNYGATGLVPSSVSGCSLTWELITSQSFNGGVGMLSVWRALGTPTTGSLTISFSSSQNGIIISWSEAANVDLTGSNGSGAIVQSVSNTGTAATSISATLAAFGSSENRPFAAVTTSNTRTITPQTSWSELSETSSAEDLTLEAQWRSDATDTASHGSWTSNSNCAIIAIEIKAASTNGTISAVVTTVTVQSPTASIAVAVTIAAVKATIDVLSTDMTFSAGSTVSAAAVTISVASPDDTFFAGSILASVLVTIDVTSPDGAITRGNFDASLVTITVQSPVVNISAGSLIQAVEATISALAKDAGFSAGVTFFADTALITVQSPSGFIGTKFSIIVFGSADSTIIRTGGAGNTVIITVGI